MNVNVLSYEDSAEIEIKKIANTTDSAQRVSILKKDGNVNMSVFSQSGHSEMDVTNYTDNLVEIEETIKPKKTAIGVLGPEFFISQGGVVATTYLPITIEAESNKISLTTPSGERYLSILPQTAADSILNTRIITKLAPDSPLSIVEDEENNLNYIIEGKKVVNVFNVYDWEIDVVARVSGVTGEVLEIETPSWLRSVNFLFV